MFTPPSLPFRTSLPWQARDAAPPAVWHAPLGATLGWAVGVALLLSLQFLTQAWVWDNWPLTEVLAAWLHLLRDRVVVALAIVLAALRAGRLTLASLRWRALLLAGAMTAGALVGELALRWLDDAPRRPLGSLAARWSLVALCIAGMFYLWRNAVELRVHWQSQTLERLHGQQQLAHAQLVALKNQIEPHFLFNTLATVRRLQRTEPAAGALMLANFLDYLRRAMPMLDRPLVPLAQELALLRAYLAVIEVRMSGRLRFEFDVPADLLALPLPPLLLATLVENAVKHGLTPAPDGGLLRIAARAGGTHCEIVVEDSGVGFGHSGGAAGLGASNAGGSAAGSAGGSGIGLANARARLRTQYGSAATLQLESRQPLGVRATLRLPLLPRVPQKERP